MTKIGDVPPPPPQLFDTTFLPSLPPAPFLLLPLSTRQYFFFLPPLSIYF